MARLLIWCLGWMQVHWSKKREAFGSIFGSNGEQSKKVAVTSRRSNVTTSPSRASQRHDVGSTIRNVVTLQRRDVSTSQRLHGIYTASFKARVVRNPGYRGVYERGHGIPEQSDTDFEEVPGICTVSHFCWILE